MSTKQQINQVVLNLGLPLDEQIISMEIVSRMSTGDQVVLLAILKKNPESLDEIIHNFQTKKLAVEENNEGVFDDILKEEEEMASKLDALTA